MQLEMLQKKVNQKSAKAAGDLDQHKIAEETAKAPSNSTRDDLIKSMTLKEIDESLTQPTEISLKKNIPQEKW